MGRMPPPRAPSWNALTAPRQPTQFEPEWRGERIIAWIYFWNEWPLIRYFVTNWLADKLDECSAWLEGHIAGTAKAKANGDLLERALKAARDRSFRDPLDPDRVLPGSVTFAKGSLEYARALEYGLAPTPEALKRFEITGIGVAPRDKWYCAKCNSTFADGFLAHNHACRSTKEWEKSGTWTEDEIAAQLATNHPPRR